MPRDSNLADFLDKLDAQPLSVEEADALDALSRLWEKRDVARDDVDRLLVELTGRDRASWEEGDVEGDDADGQERDDAAFWHECDGTVHPYPSVACSMHRGSRPDEAPIALARRLIGERDEARAEADRLLVEFTGTDSAGWEEEVKRHAEWMAVEDRGGGPISCPTCERVWCLASGRSDIDLSPRECPNCERERLLRERAETRCLLAEADAIIADLLNGKRDHTAIEDWIARSRGPISEVTP